MIYRLALLEKDWKTRRAECEKDLGDSIAYRDKVLRRLGITKALDKLPPQARFLIGPFEYAQAWSDNVLTFSIMTSLPSGVVPVKAFDGQAVRALSGYGKSRLERVEGKESVLVWEGMEEITEEEYKKEFGGVTKAVYDAAGEAVGKLKKKFGNVLGGVKLPKGWRGASE